MSGDDHVGEHWAGGPQDGTDGRRERDPNAVAHVDPSGVRGAIGEIFRPHSACPDARHARPLSDRLI